MPDHLHHVVDLDLQPHEASGLVPCRSAALREAVGWDPLYWTVLDDGPVEECIALVGQVAGTMEPTAGWGSRHLAATIATPTDRGTDDGEAIAEHDGWVTVLGSAYGAKEGPLEPERSFVARFHVDDVTVDDDGTPRVDLHVVADPFVLHRVINDALHTAGVDLVAWSPKYRRKTVGRARKQAVADDAPWAWRLAHDDSPVNIEGAAYLDDGSLLLGLRIPVTRTGQAIVVRVRWPERLFDPAVSDPEPAEVIVLEGIGSRAAPVGVRDLEVRDGRLHAIVGDLDSDPDDSILLAQHPEGGVAESVHVVADLPDLAAEAPVQVDAAYERWARPAAPAGGGGPRLRGAVARGGPGHRRAGPRHVRQRRGLHGADPLLLQRRHDGAGRPGLSRPGLSRPGLSRPGLS